MPKTDTIIAIKPEGKKSGRRKGILPAVGDELLGRRRLQKGIYIKYFDPAQYADGTERPFFYDLDFSPLGYVTGWTGGLPSARHTCCPWPPFADTSGYRDPYNAYLTTGDREDWADIYREAKADETVQFFATYNSSYVEGKGYPVAEANNAINNYSLGYSDGGRQQLWQTFNTSVDALGSQTKKVTREPDYDDDGVTFVLDSSCDVFLAPTPKFWEGRATSFLPIAFPALSGPFFYRQTLFLLNHFLRTIPRSASVDNDLYRGWWEYIADGLVTPGGVFPTTLTTELRQFMYDLFTGLPESRSQAIDAEAWANGPDGLSHDPNDYTVDLAFPNTYSGTGLNFNGNLIGSVDNPVSWMDLPIVRWFTWYQPEGLLAGVIHKKGGADAGWYYVWRTVAASISQPYPSAAFPTIPNIASADLGARV